MDHDDGVLVDGSDGLDEVVSVQLRLWDQNGTGEIVRDHSSKDYASCTYGDVCSVDALSRDLAEEDESGLLEGGDRGGSLEVVVVEVPVDARPPSVLPRLGLDRLERGDQVRVVVRSRAPALSDDAVGVVLGRREEGAGRRNETLASLRNKDAEPNVSIVCGSSEQKQMPSGKGLTGPASSPMMPIVRISPERGRAPPTFLSSTVEAAPISRMPLSEGRRRTGCRVSSWSVRELKLVVLQGRTCSDRPERRRRGQSQGRRSCWSCS